MTLAPDTQLALDGLSERLAESARRHFSGDLHGRLILACGLAGPGAIQPLAATRQGAAFLGIESDPEQIKRALRSGYCEIMVNSLDEALRILKNAVRSREPASVGLIGDCSAVIGDFAERGVVPDIVLLGSAVPALSEKTSPAVAPAITKLQRLGALLLDPGSAPGSTGAAE